MSQSSTSPVSAFEQWVRERGWRVLERRRIDHGVQLVVTDGTSRLPVNIYTTGKVLVQGPAGVLRTALSEWANLQRAGPGVAGDARIGVDESGKGDVFGPLVVAAVCVMPEVELDLAKRGVRDSKTVSDVQARELAAQIRGQCPHEVLEVRPPEYNAAYERFGRNLNHLLAWGHARVIAALSARVPARRAISDQFGNVRLVAGALKAEGCEITLEQRPHAESDLAVAAASILARAAFVTALDAYSVRAGVQIPRGASAPEVTATLRLLHARWGVRGLERIAKMHFRTVQAVMAEGTHTGE